MVRPTLRCTALPPRARPPQERTPQQTGSRRRHARLRARSAAKAIVPGPTRPTANQPQPRPDLKRLLLPLPACPSVPNPARTAASGRNSDQVGTTKIEGHAVPESLEALAEVGIARRGDGGADCAAGSLLSGWRQRTGGA